jgi:hypothetical protein
MHPLANYIIIFTITIIVIVAIYLLVERILKHREREWAFVLRQDNNKALASLRVSAYERIIIMLERTTPTSLIMRRNVGTMSAAMLQLELMKALREEFDHNVSLQIYVSNECWERVKRAKDETTELIKVAFTKVSPESPGIELSREIFKLEAAVGNGGTREAIFAIRAEMGKYF